MNESRPPELALRESEAKFHTLTETVPALIFIYQGGALRFINHWAERILGYSAAELKQLNFWELIHEDFRERLQIASGGGEKPGRGVTRCEFKIVTKSGEQRWLDCAVAPMVYEGAPAVIGSAFDITERKRAEQRLAESETRWRMIFDTEPECVKLLGLDGKLWEMNPAGLAMIEVDTMELVRGQDAQALLVPEYRPAFQQLLKAVGQGQSAKVEYQILGLKGTYRWIETHAAPYLDDRQQIVGVLAISRDITEQKRLENQTRAFSQLGKQLSSARTPREAARVTLRVADELFRWDAASLHLIPAGSEGLTPVLVVDTINDERVESALIQSESGLTPMSSRVLRDGAQLIVRRDQVAVELVPFGDVGRKSEALMFVPIRDGKRTIGVMSVQSYTANAFSRVDLAALQTLADYCGGAFERLRMEAALRNSHAQYHTLAALAPVGIFRADPGGTCTYVNRVWSEMFGRSLEQVASAGWLAAVHASDQEFVRAQWNTFAREGRPFDLECRYLRADGTVMWGWMQAVAERDGSGTITGFVGTVVDITQRKQNEELLRQAEEMYRSMFENAIEGIFQVTADGRFLSVNPALAHMLGYASPEELLAVVTDLGRQLYAEAHQFEEFKQLLNEQGVVRNFEAQLVCQDRRLIWVLTNARVVRGPGNVILYYEGTHQNITERRRFEAQLQQAQKMEGVGRLAGGIAHDFNNLLLVILGSCDLLMMSNETSPVVREQLEQIRKAGQRAATLTQQLLAFGRRQLLQLQTINLREFLENVRPTLTAILGNRIELALDLDSAPAWVRVDPGQLELVLTNLALNSREAMPSGGRLVLTTALVTVTDASAHSGLRAGSYVLLSLRDTGCGMTPEVKAHLFEPFFTTKSRAKGSGLGLSTAYGIIKQTGGHIEVESEPNQGATVKIYLPHAVGPDSELETPGIALPSESLVPAERPTILLVEDADAVRVMLLKLLERSGYHVLSAEDGVDALAVRARHAGPIRLLITDVVMPKMNGRELAEKLQQIEPGLNVLFISGFTDNILDQATQGFPSAGFLQKPFSTEVFLRKVQELMEAAL